MILYLLFKKNKKIFEKVLTNGECYDIIIFVERECWNWQTGKTKDLVSV